MHFQDCISKCHCISKCISRSISKCNCILHCKMQKMQKCNSIFAFFLHFALQNAKNAFKMHFKMPLHFEMQSSKCICILKCKAFQNAISGAFLHFALQNAFFDPKCKCILHCKMHFRLKCICILAEISF